MLPSEIPAGQSGNYSSQMIRMVVTIALILCVFVATCDGQNNQPSCGKRLVNLGYLIYHGQVSTRGSWPWYAAIYHRDHNIFTYQCGGSIIGKNTILTAAHCVRLAEDDISVRVGHVDLNVMNSQPGYSVRKVIVHPQFVDKEHDIAVVILSTDIVMDQYVQPICLWSMDDSHGQLEGKTGTVVGFGFNEHDKVSPFLKETTLTVADVFSCLLNDEGYRAVLTPNMYCAGGRNGSSPCNGDSGGGMYFQKEGTWYIRGLVSFSARRPNTNVCDPSKYTLFTFVSKYTGWMASIRRQSSLTHLEPTKGTLIGTKDITSNVANRYEHGFLIAIKYDSIIRVPLNGSKSSIIRANDGTQGIDHDCAKGRFYWGNAGGTISSAKYDGTDPKSFITKDIIAPVRVAVDWISRRLYWTDYRKNTIEVASLENPDVRTVLISEDLESPWAIAFDPLTSKLYWSHTFDGKKKIEWANLDGSERQVLVSSPQIENVWSIQVSRGTGEVCYIDGDTKRIECIDPHSKQIRTIASNLTDPRAFAITDQLFYWIEWNMNSIESIDQNGVRQKPIISLAFDFRYSRGLTAVTDKCPLSYSPCAINNGYCPVNTICLVNPSVPAGRSCVVIK